MEGIREKVVVITGATSGIGRELARGLAAQGARLSLAGRREERLEEIRAEIAAMGVEVIVRVTDVTSPESVADLMQATIRRFGAIDVLVNNAGIMPASDLSLNRYEEWSRLIDTNIKGVLYGIGAVLSHMRERGGGHIINVASTDALSDVYPGATVYGVTKHAVRLISDGLRREEELAGSGIRVTTVFPGGVDTELYTAYATDETMASADEWADAPVMQARDMVAPFLFAIGSDPRVAVTEITLRPMALAREGSGDA